MATVASVALSASRWAVSVGFDSYVDSQGFAKRVRRRVARQARRAGFLSIGGGNSHGFSESQSESRRPLQSPAAEPPPHPPWCEVRNPCRHGDRRSRRETPRSMSASPRRPVIRELGDDGFRNMFDSAVDEDEVDRALSTSGLSRAVPRRPGCHVLRASSQCGRAFEPVTLTPSPGVRPPNIPSRSR